MFKEYSKQDLETMRFLLDGKVTMLHTLSELLEIDVEVGMKLFIAINIGTNSDLRLVNHDSKYETIKSTKALFSSLELTKSSDMVKFKKCIGKLVEMDCIKINNKHEFLVNPSFVQPYVRGEDEIKAYKYLFHKKENLTIKEVYNTMFKDENKKRDYFKKRECL